MAGGGLSRLLKQLKVDDWLGPILDATRPSEPESWGEPSLFVRPSAAGGPCALELQLIQLGHRWPISSGLRALMDAGTQAHERITGSDYVRSEVLVFGEVRLTTYLDDTPTHVWFAYGPTGPAPPMQEAPPGPVEWSGEVDVIVRNPVTGTVHIGEIKKANSFRIKRLPAEAGDDPAVMARKMLKAEPRYVRQLARYVAEFRSHADALGEEISDLAFFHWEDANTQATRIIWIRVEPWLVADARAFADVAETATAEGRVVEFPHKRSSPTCSKCDRRKLCNQLREGDESAWQTVRTAIETVNATRPQNLGAK